MSHPPSPNATDTEAGPRRQVAGAAAGRPIPGARMAALLTPNLRMLEQAACLCRGLGEERFQAACRELGGSTVGQHVRHCLDHFERFVVGIPDGRIDYDSRDRQLETERNPEAAAGTARRMMARLETVLEGLTPDQPVEVTQACSVSGDVLPEASTCGRELQFLVSHTVHHFAMIAAICRLHAVEMPGDFGVAPSTLRYRASQ